MMKIVYEQRKCSQLLDKTNVLVYNKDVNVRSDVHVLKTCHKMQNGKVLLCFWEKNLRSLSNAAI